MINNTKISIRFFDDREVRAIWDEENNKWWFSVLDIVAVLTSQDDYTKTRNYWKYLKAKLKKEGNELGSDTTQLKLKSPDGKMRLSNVLDYDGIIALAKHFPNNKAAKFLDWFLIATTVLTDRVRKKRMHSLKAILLAKQKSEQRKVYSKFMRISLAGYMILPGKSDKRTFRKAVFSSLYRIS